MDMTETEPRSNSRRRRGRRNRKPQYKELLGSISDALLVVVVIGSALAIGSVHIPALLAISALALVGATLEALAFRHVPWPSVVLGALGLYSAFQAIPLPAALVSSVSQASAEVWLRCLAPFGEPAPRYFSLSLDPSASIAEALKWVTYASVYVMAIRARARRGSGWLAVLLFGSVTLVAVITLLHGIADLPELYGLYHPQFTPGRWNVGPLLNSNNLAGYTILGLFTGGGLLLSGRSPVPRLALMIGIGVIAAVLALSNSRGGVLSVILAGVVVLVWLLRAKDSRISLRGFGLGIAPLALGIVIAVALGTTDQANELASIDVQRKTSVWLWSLPMIRDHALFGVGRGAFETAFQSYRGALAYDWAIVVTHAENFVVQWIAEWGIPLGACAVVLIVAYVSREWYRSRSDRRRFMVLTGLVALLVQNFVDLGLEIPAVAIAAILALVAGERPMPAVSATEPSDGSRRLGKFALVAASPALALWIAALVWARTPVEVERRALSASYGELAIVGEDALAIASAKELATLDAPEPAPSSSAEELERFRNQLRQAVLRHPGEAFFPLLGSLVAQRTRDGHALAWVARALELAPMNGPAHLVLADLLQSHGATIQAMLHLRLAGQYDRTLGGSVSARASAWAPSIDVLMQAIPDGPYGQQVLLHACEREGRIALKFDCFRRAVARSPNLPKVQLEFAESLLRAVQASEPPCNDALAEACIAEAEVAIRAAQRIDPKAWRPGYLLSKVLRTRGDTVGAAQLLTRTCPPSFEGEECWHEALALALKSGATDTVTVAANALATRPCDGMESCAKMYASLASNLESGGQLALASKFFIKAAQSDPSADRWIKVGELAARANLNGVARAACDRADRSFDASPASRAHVELLRERVARATSAQP